MKTAPAACTVFRAEDLLPAPWQHFAAEGPVRTFNPGLLRDGDGWLLAYRIVGTDALRRIALCRLDRSLQVSDGTQVALTDAVRFRPGHSYPGIVTQWFADPRLYRFGGRLFIYWNSGWHEPLNHQFIQELDAATLSPLGHPRELLLGERRQKLEKNWTFFGAGEDHLHAIYSILPHRVLQFSLRGEGDIEFTDEVVSEWSLADYPVSHGGLRGGAPPQRMADGYWSFCHTVHDGAAGYRYAAAVYRFAAAFPFAPTHRPNAPLDLGTGFGAQREHPRLNPAAAEVIYPCGAALDGTRWLISHGVNDERCAISILDHVDVLRAVCALPVAGNALQNRQQ